ncbi:hypothetical protein XFPR_12970 [Xylella fastidiosa]|nr:hypothetical protein [Xylella fastidiosa]ETE30405.1 hypothetical protein B398_10555 [Xylella fastidiosa 32]QPB72942.1 hypothetical protein XFPR_12970 [Xylella fastidiosa]WGZ34023.1 hypothetical protein O4445_10315 [Xylella fastidiosa subsp. pauca]
MHQTNTKTFDLQRFTDTGHTMTLNGNAASKLETAFCKCILVQPEQ